MAQPVKLEHIEEFREAIAQLHFSEHAQQVLQDARLVVMSGLAGGGRNTVINYLVEHHGYLFLVSDTTRPPKLRDGIMEQNGVQYYFRTETDMLHDIRSGEFIEAEIIHNQQVSGTSIRELERANESGKIAINDFEYLGAQNVAAAKPDAFIIGLLPPSYDEWIRRFQAREEIHPQEFLNRLRTAEKVLEAMLQREYYRFVINDTIEQAAQDLREIVEQGIVDPEKQKRGIQVATGILDRVRTELTRLHEPLA